MIHREDRYLDFRTRIRNANSHSEAEEILRDLSPEHIRDVCDRLVEKHGSKGTYKDGTFEVWSLTGGTLPKWRIMRGDKLVFHQEGSKIYAFETLRTWNILNLLEEIIETGEIEI